MKKPENWSLKSQLTWSFMAVVLCITLAVSLLYYHSQRRLFEDNLIEASTNDVDYLMGNLEKQLRLCEKLSDWIYVNRRMEATLIRSYQDDMEQFSREIPPIQRLIDDQLLSSSVGKYVIFLIIHGNNGISFKVMTDADWIDRSDLTGRTWFKAGMAAGGGILWTGIWDNPASYKTTDTVVPIVRPVIFSDTRAQIGWQSLAFSPALISDVFQDYRIDESRRVIVVDQNGKAVFHYDPLMTGKAVEPDLVEAIGRSGGSRFMTVDGKRTLVTYKWSDYSGMTVLLLHSLTSLEEQANVTRFVMLASVALIGAMFFILTYYLSNRLTKPLVGILAKLEQVSDGDFGMDHSINGNDEMGLIGRGINKMAGDIRSLMNELIQREHEKCELEYRVLLNQINPHFVYNVLNSIKVMADIQKIEGISEMASSLGMLLKEISKGSAEQVTIKRELELLESYLYLQKIRRSGMLTVGYDIPDPSVLSCLIPRFTLQPLAENAIYHGLDQIDRMGIIRISIQADGGDIVIRLQDNGAGIPEDKIATLLSEEYARGEELTHVGLPNVYKRIKSFYGSGEMRIESVVGEFTSVFLRFPRKEN